VKKPFTNGEKTVKTVDSLVLSMGDDSVLHSRKRATICLITHVHASPRLDSSSLNAFCHGCRRDSSAPDTALNVNEFHVRPPRISNSLDNIEKNCAVKSGISITLTA